jgi:hypothetical protein
MDMKNKRLLTNKELYMPKSLVHHWRFNDGVTPINPGNPFGEMIPPRGWSCWVYPKDDTEFYEWMGRMCPSADITHRFNSGDPMWTVNITNDKEAMLFTLKYGN